MTGKSQRAQPPEQADIASANRSPQASRANAGKVTWRSILIGLGGAVFICAVQVAEKVTPQRVILPFGSVTTLLPGVVCWLFTLSVLNVVLKRWWPRYALRPAEFAAIYAITTVAAAIAAQDEVQFLLPMWTYPFRAAKAKDAGPFLQYIPHWLAQTSPRIVEPYYSGHVDFLQPYLLRAWFVPLAFWMLWLTGLGTTMWAWNVILRRRWIDHDRLEFPCIRLPLEMCREAGFGGLAGGRIFWTGFALSALIESLNQIHLRFPDVPSIMIDFDASPLLNNAPSPWNALSPMYLTWTTLHLGICYFIPLDILFSSWFFFLVRKGLEVFGRSMGWRDLGWDAAGFPFTRAQAAGAWIMLFFLLVWAERHHLTQVMRAAFSPRRTTMNAGGSAASDDTREPGSYRWAARILVAGTVFMIVWSMAAGLSLWMAIAFYGLFWMLSVTMTRIYAQVGPPLLELYYMDPGRTIIHVFGSVGQSPASLTHLSLLYWINRDHRGQPMAHQLASFRVAQEAHADMRSIGKLVLVAFVVGCITCLLAYLWWAYRVGEDQFMSGGWRESGAGYAISTMHQWIETPKGPQWTEIAYMTVGAAITWALAKLSYVWIGCPFHPIGFALAMCFAVEYNWPAFLGMWLVKLLILRYGGRKLYLNLAPLFLGLVLGGFVVPVGWGFVSYLFNWYS